ncbi:MAG: OprO/OprP family phosphate-selective porin [Staphylococcus sp.]|nr:OprO/OprP family phosphate-selective porin [Staphylococcus sp.]
MKPLLCTAIAGFCTLMSLAQSSGVEIERSEIARLEVEARLDYQLNRIDGNTVDSNSGFEGKYLVIRLDGNITDNLSYSWRQRLNKNHNDGSFFDATDWVWINYDIDSRWSVAGGKQVVAIGGWEYDRAPIDLYGCSVFWNNIPCYQIGASASLNLSATDKLTLQACQSPFFTSSNRNLYAYNLLWSGTHGCFSALWSANMIEYTSGRYISYISLGNRFSAGKVALELDFMNRASSHQQYFFKDCSVMGEISYRPALKWNVYAKMTYDVNHSGTNADYCVLDGTELTMAGGGLEFYPLSNHRSSLRLHANCFYSWGNNANTGNVMQDKTLLLDVGVKWDMNLFSIKRR